MHLCGFFKGEKGFDIYFAVCVQKKKNSLLGLEDLSEYGHCTDFYWVIIMLIWICRNYSIVNDTDENNNFKQWYFVNL